MIIVFKQIENLVIQQMEKLNTANMNCFMQGGLEKQTSAN
jgi:hypothetical protein